MPLPAFDHLSLDIPKSFEDGAILLGAPVGSASFCIATVSQRVSKAAALMQDLTTLNDP